MAEQYDIRLSHTRPGFTSLTFRDGAGSPINLTSHTCTVRVRSLDDTDATIADLTSAGSQVVLGGVAGTILINWAPVITQMPEVGHYRVDVTTSTGTNRFVTSGTIMVEDKP